MLVQQFAKIQDTLTESADRDWDKGHYGKFAVKNFAYGVLEGVLINGIVITAFGAGILVYDAVSKIRRK